MYVIISDKVVKVNENSLISSGYTMKGNIYLLGDNEVIKLYHYVNSCSNELRRGKLECLSKIDVKKFIMPLEIVYDEKGNVIGHTMKYIRGNNGDAILRCSSKFLIEELEKVHEEVSILSLNNIVIDDLIADNVIVNENGIFFIDTDEYIIRTRLNYEKNMIDSNFNINIFLKEIFARNYLYRKNDDIYNMFDSYDIFYEIAKKYYKPNQNVKSLVKCMIRGK